MPRYVRETHHYDDGGFTTVGRVVDVFSHSVGDSRVTVLVEKPEQISFEGVADSASSERIDFKKTGSEEPVPRVPAESETTCAGKDGECSRTVDEAGDYCWQHD